MIKHSFVQKSRQAQNTSLNILYTCLHNVPDVCAELIIFIALKTTPFATFSGLDHFCNLLGLKSPRVEKYREPHILIIILLTASTPKIHSSKDITKNGKLN